MEQPEQIYGLSPMQQGMLFHALLTPEARPYFEQGIFTIRGKIHSQEFEQAWRRAVEFYAVLRTSFHWKNLDSPVQVVHRKVVLPFTWLDWSSLSPEERKTRFAQLVLDDRAEGFDLAKAPLLRVQAIALEQNEYQLLVSFHHLLLDAWSLQLLLRTVNHFYLAQRQGTALQLDPPRGYKDYIAWLQKQDLSAAEAFWREELVGLQKSTSLAAAASSSSADADGAFASYEYSIPADSTAKLRALASRCGVTLNAVIQGAWGLFLSRYTGANDVVFGMTVSGRPAELAGVETMVGLFINTLPLRLTVDGDTQLGPWLRALQDSQQQAMQYQYSPLSLVQTWGQLPPGMPLFDHLLVFEGIPEVGVKAENPEDHLEFAFELIERTGYPLTLTVQPGEQILLQFTYSRRHFDERMIGSICGDLQAILQQITQDHLMPLSAVSLASGPRSVSRLARKSNSTESAYPRLQGLVGLFEEQAARVPGRVAVEDRRRSLTYQQLNDEANRLAHRLIELGVGPESLVGVCVERSAGMLVTLLAVLKSGAAYVPLDPRYPAQRILYVLEDSGASVLITEPSLLTGLSYYKGSIITLEDQPAVDEKHRAPNPARTVSPENLAYVIYTSGSTGKPKGVGVNHGALVNFLSSMRTLPGIQETDLLLAVTTLSFDIAGLELYLPLLVGARVRIPTWEVVTDGAALLKELNRGVTVLQATPATWLLLLEAGWVRSPRLKALCGGEALTPDLAAKLTARCEQVWNMYGPTETTIWSLVKRIEGTPARVLIGRPIANTQVYVLDDQVQPVPDGAVGELYLGGDGLARGYLHRREMTAERFVPNPFADAPGQRMYRTGDLARWNTEGEVECLGRVDHQVKIRGYRIETAEIENVLLEYAGLKQAVVIAREDDPGQKSLAAYVVARAAIDLSELRSHLRQRLPEYMVPSAFVQMEVLPLTPNGKIDRRALPVPAAERPAADGYVAPRTPTEEIAAGIWAEVLKLPRVGVADNFFELGATSLLATRVMSRVRKSIGLDLPLKTLFEAPTVAAFAARIDTVLEAETPHNDSAIKPSAGDQDLPLSFAQQRLWFMDKLEPESAAYNMPFGVRLVGPLDKAALVRAFDEIVQRHGILRTRFIEREGTAYQRVEGTVDFQVEEFDLEPLSPSMREEAATSIERKDANLPFDFSRAPLFRVKLVRFSANEHVLLTNMHHIVSDGWSLELLMREFAALYEAYSEGLRSPLPALEVQYGDYAVWQRDWLQGERLEEQVAYWRKELDGLTTLELPVDRPRPAVPTRQGGDVPLALGKDLTEKIKTFSREQGVTVFMTLLAGLQLLLASYSGQEDIVVGTDVANRNQFEIEPLVGFFVNQLVLRTRVNSHGTLAQLVQEVRKVTLGAYAHQDLPFEKLVEELHPERNLSREPIFQVKVVMQNAVQAETITGGLEISRFGGGLERVRQDLELDVAETPDGIKGFLHYATDLFDHWRMELLVEHYTRVLAAFVGDPQETVANLVFMSDAESRKLLVEWNKTEVAYRSAPIHSFFESQAASLPESTAVIWQDQRVSYVELNRRANQLAHHLQSSGIQTGSLVGICVERSVDTLVSLLGILKSGAAYVPLDPTYPQDRLHYMAENANLQLLLTQDRLLTVLPQTSCPVVNLDRLSESLRSLPTANMATQIEPEALAYVIYTSGSTGQPKGVQITHRSVANFFTAMDRAIGCSPADTLLAVTGISFDISVLELLWTLANGATVVLAAEPFRLATAGIEQRSILDLAAAYSPTLMQCTPSTLKMVFAGGESVAPLNSLRQLLLGGEALPPSLATQVRSALPATLWNMYGPTETTVWSAVSRVDEADEPASISIGRPIANTSMYILDSRQAVPVPLGSLGELYIGGDGLARGYLDLPALTAEKFIPDAFGSRPGSRLYVTGDMARYRPDGTIELVGRRDHQVKIRGFRIELGEIELAIAGYPGVQDVAVVAKDLRHGDKQLVAYIVAAGEVSAGEIQQALRAQLPGYMVPAAFVTLEALPLTPNGKVDRRALLTVDQDNSARPQTFVSPRTETEQYIAGIWERVLGLERVGAEDNFFDLGGHSLLLVQVHRELAPQHDVTVVDLFAYPTVSLLAQHLDRRRGDGEEADAVEERSRLQLQAISALQEVATRA